MYQFDTGWRQGEKGGGGLRLGDVLGAFKRQAKVLHETLDSLVQVGDRDGDMIQGCNHLLLSYNCRKNPSVTSRRLAAISSADSSTTRSSGEILKMGWPFLMMEPSVSMSTFSMVPAKGA